MECDILVVFKKLNPKNGYVKFYDSDVSEETFLHKVFNDLDKNELNQIVSIVISDISCESLNSFLSIMKENGGRFNFEENNNYSTIKESYIKKYRQ
jgi:hypothetical protein